MFRVFSHPAFQLLLVSLAVTGLMGAPNTNGGITGEIAAQPAQTGVTAGEVAAQQAQSGSSTYYLPIVFNQKNLVHTSMVLHLARQGFDACTAPVLNKLQTWWNYSPYYFVNLYIGGVHRLCANTALNGDYVEAAAKQGWAFVPTWVGPQAACSKFKYRFSLDPATAARQGRDEANAAAQAAAALKLTSPTIIYYDLENYFDSRTECRNASKAFINGWVARLRELGIKGGVYGGPYGSYLYDFWSIANVPDDVWVAYWPYKSYTSSAWPYGLPNLPDSTWPQRRIWQYAGEVTENWAGASLAVDLNVADGEVAAYPLTQVAALGAAGMDSPAAAQPVRVERTPQIAAAELVDAGAGWALVDGRLLWSDSAGRAWDEIPLPGEAAPVLAVAFRDARRGWVARATADGSLEVLATSDGGATWASTALPGLSPASDPPATAAYFDAAPGGDLYLSLKLASGANFSLGALFHSADGGATWERRALPIGAPVRFSDGQRGWTAGGPAGSELYATADGGRTWQPLAPDPSSPARYGLPAFTSAEAGYLPAVSGDDERPSLAIYATRDGGRTWRPAGAVPLADGAPDGPPELIAGGGRLVASGAGTALALNAAGETLTAGGALALPAAAGALSFQGADGWAVVQTGACSGTKLAAGAAPAEPPQELRCWQRWQLLATSDGGATWNDITP